MRRSTLAICALLMVATSGCDQVNTAKAKLKLAWDKLRGRSTQTAPPPPARPAPDTAGARVVAQQEQTQHRGPRPPAAPSGNPPANRDVPYRSQDTGTVAPGMTEREIYELWAAPAAAQGEGEGEAWASGGCRRPDSRTARAPAGTKTHRSSDDRPTVRLHRRHAHP